jgi:hypothetical protein
LRVYTSRAERGLIDADSGGGLIKERVARPGEERSGGYRMVVVYQAKNRAFLSTVLQRMSAITLKTTNCIPCVM